tara:strand:- start:49899 stop:50096 length:198 start_codon:yes stop_codon:yes gene_type:complete
MNYKIVLRITDRYDNVEDILVAYFESSGSAIVSANALNEINKNEFPNQKYVVEVIEIKNKKNNKK